LKGFVSVVSSVSSVPLSHPIIYISDPVVPGMRSLTARLQGFAGHGGSILSTGAGWPQWKPLDTPGTHLGWVNLLEKYKIN